MRLGAEGIAQNAQIRTFRDGVARTEIAKGDGRGIGCDIGHVLGDQHRVAQQAGRFARCKPVRPQMTAIRILERPDRRTGEIPDYPWRSAQVERLKPVLEMMELDAIAAVALGGTPLTGGYGRVIKTIIGARTLTLVRNGLTIAGVPPSWSPVALGLLLIAAIAISLNRSKIDVVK